MIGPVILMTSILFAQLEEKLNEDKEKELADLRLSIDQFRMDNQKLNEIVIELNQKLEFAKKNDVKLEDVKIKHETSLKENKCLTGKLVYLAAKTEQILNKENERYLTYIHLLN